MGLCFRVIPRHLVEIFLLRFPFDWCEVCFDIPKGIHALADDMWAALHVARYVKGEGRPKEALRLVISSSGSRQPEFTEAAALGAASGFFDFLTEHELVGNVGDYSFSRLV